MSLQEMLPDCGDRITYPFNDVVLDRMVSIDAVVANRRPPVAPMRPRVGPAASPAPKVAVRDRDRPTRVLKASLDRLLRAEAPHLRPAWTSSAPSCRHGPFTYAATTLRLFKEGASPDLTPFGRFIAMLSSGEELAAPPTNAEARSDLSRRLVLMLTTLSELISAMGGTSCALDGRAGFLMPIDDLLRDRVTVPPQRLRDFSDALHLDLRSSVLERGRIDFAWGDLQIVDRRLTLSVKRQDYVGPKLGGRVTVLE